MTTETPRPPQTTRPAPATSRVPAATSDPTLRTQRDLAFKDFGVVDTGKQDKRSYPVALLIFGSVLTAALMIKTTVKKQLEQQKVITFNAVKPLPPEPPKPKPIVKLPPPPKIKPIEPIKPPIVVETPEPPKIQPPVVKPAPEVVKTSPAPKAVEPPPAPKPVAIQIAQAASVPNNSAHPSPVRLGNLTNPINNTSGPAVSPINLGRSGAPGMNASNSGLGNPTKIALSGSGSPNGTNMAGRDNAAVPIRGLSNGMAGSNGSGPARAGAIQIAMNNKPQPVATQIAQPVSAPRTAPKVLFKPRPEYTEDAKNAHIEGSVAVRIHVTSSGSVQVLGVSSSLGHGLDQAAERAAQGMRFQPATQDGKAVDWDGVVNITFQLAS
ncbi:energy transducer TonB [Terriglobus aquaticus]|uniref:TonB family protein n=1 Tax=Terriglobus aquaticus TaxID=940139 RepID=A0ABW9KLG4_9BACT|nr:TonB family protein [Terriglobus aquaticus]